MRKLLAATVILLCILAAMLAAAEMPLYAAPELPTTTRDGNSLDLNFMARHP